MASKGNKGPEIDPQYAEWFSLNTREGKEGILPDDPNLDYDYYSYYQDMNKGVTPFVDPDSGAPYPDTYRLGVQDSQFANGGNVYQGITLNMGDPSQSVSPQPQKEYKYKTKSGITTTSKPREEDLILRGRSPQFLPMEAQQAPQTISALNSTIPQRSVSYQKLVDSDDNPIFTPIFKGGWNQQSARGFLDQSPNEFGGIPVSKQQFSQFNNNTILPQSPYMALTEQEQLAQYKDGGKVSKRRVKVIRTPQAANGATIQGDNNIQPLSQSFGRVVGDTHAEGGEPILANGQPIEAEHDEPVSINQQGDVVFWGKMKNPITGNLFKNDAKDLANQENKLAKQMNQGQDLISNNSPDILSGLLAFNAGRVKIDASRQKENYLNSQKESFGEVQQSILDFSRDNNIEPKDYAKKMREGGVVKMADGGTMSKDSMVASARLAAMKYGVDPNIIERLIQQESGFNPKAESKAGAKGIGQFVPSTAKQYGLDPNKLKSTKPEDIEAQIDAVAKHFSELQTQFNGDPILAAASYNGGPGWSNSKTYQKGKDGPVATAAKYLGIPKEEMTGEKLMGYYADKKQNRPSKDSGAFVNENYDYVNNIFNLDDKDFYGSGDSKGVGSAYREKYYAPTPETASSVPPPLPTAPDFSLGLPNIDTADKPQPTATTPIQPQAVQPISTATSNQPQPIQDPRNKPSLADRNKLGVFDFLPEIGAILDQPDYVPGQQFAPELYQPYQVSFQDRINQNQSNFNQVAQLIDNPGALATLAGQLYGANQQVLGDEFRTNQGIANQVTNQNVQLLNQAQQTNLGLEDQQFLRQSQAQATTDTNRQNALNSLSNKYAQNRSQNNKIRLMENMFDYRPDANMNMVNYNEAPNFDAASGKEYTPAEKESLRIQIQQQKLEQQKLKTAEARQKGLLNIFGR